MRAICFFLSILFISGTLYSQEQQVDYEFTIDSKHFNKERKIYVHLPEDYYLLKDEKMGVVYMLDGQGTSFFNNAKSIIDYLVWGYQIFPVIVVGIHSDDRGPEFVPKDKKLADDDPDNYGTADLLQQHLAEEVFPLIEEKFRTNKFRALIGHSRGGAFVANTLFSDKKDMFNAYVAISPGMHYVDNQILNQVEEVIKSSKPLNKFFYASYGTVGSLEKYFKPQVEFIDSLLTEHPNPTLVWEKKQFDNTTHWGVVSPTINYAMLSISRAFQADQLLIDKFCENKSKSVTAQIEDYYADQQKALGLTFAIPARKLRYYANQQSEYENYERAIELYDLAIVADQSDQRIYSGAAWAHRQLGNKEKAKVYYEKCIQLIERNEMGWNSDRQERSISNFKKYIQEMYTEDKN